MGTKSLLGSSWTEEPFDKAKYVPEELQDKVTLWMLRVLIDLGAYKALVDKSSGLTNILLASYLGLDDFIDRDDFESSAPLLVLKKRKALLESRTPITSSGTLAKNIDRLREMIGLSENEARLFEFVIVLRQIDLLGQSTDLLGRDLNTTQVIWSLSLILDISHHEVQEMFKTHSRLTTLSILTIEKEYTHSLQEKLKLGSSSFGDDMYARDEEIEVMMRDVIRRCGMTPLKTSDYDHIASEVAMVQTYLQHSIERRKPGVNVLFYGRPGTGKTELAKMLAQGLDVKLYEVSYADDDDEPVHRSERIRSYKIAQAILESRNGLLLYDEAEDIFENDSGPFGFHPQNEKAWLNRMLETNAVPTIWTTNDISSIDPAIVRRFDIVTEVPIPKKSKRQQIIRDHSKGMLDDASIKHLAQNEHIVPAIVSRAAKVVEAVQSGGDDTSKMFDMLIGNTLKAQGHGTLDRARGEALMQYDPAYVNTSVDLYRLAEGIKEEPNARLCLYGVPGTGKSAFGRWLAETIERPFMLMKGSDLISKWVGDTERNIADAFEKAKDENAVLVFDEVDSFLRDRRGSDRSWEVTQVNEMLVQMEAFEGVFIATTNLLEALDQASLRRFDLKLEFGYLDQEQAWHLLLDELSTLGLERPHNIFRRDLSRLQSLAPGDFAAVRRQHRFDPISDVEDYLRRLSDECQIKAMHFERKVGFRTED